MLKNISTPSVSTAERLLHRLPSLKIDVAAYLEFQLCVCVCVCVSWRRGGRKVGGL